MRSSRAALILVVLVAWTCAVTASAAPAPKPDPIAIEIARWQAILNDGAPVDDETKSIRAGSAPLLAQAERALAAGQRWIALSRLALVWSNLEAAQYRTGFPSELRAQQETLEREWRRLAPTLSDAAKLSATVDFERVPAAARAVGEAALQEVAVYYDASLEYGENTAPEYGLFYLGAAQAQLDLSRLTARLARSDAAARASAVLRSVAPEIEALEDELLLAYAPPASIEQHPVFIRISASLKQARELDAAGMHHGALYRLLDARMRLSRMRHPGRTLDAATATTRATAQQARWTATGLDHGVAEIYLENAVLSATDLSLDPKGGEVSAAILEDVIPLYQAALGPAPPRPPDRKAEATVTLVRWPYT